MSRLKIKEVFPTPVEKIHHPEDFLYCFAPIEPISANPVLRELMGLKGAQLVYRAKIEPSHLVKAKKWQFLEKIDSITKLRTNSGKKFYDGIQLMAKNKDPIKLAVKFINNHANQLGVSFIDLNFCCPGHKVRPQHRGGELLRNPHEIIKVVDQVLKYAELPVSLKIRRGYTINDSPMQLCKLLCLEFGSNIGWIALNRAPVKMGGVDINELATDTSAFTQAQTGLDYKIPLIANGEIHTYQDLLPILQTQTVSGIMIGRAALGNPSLFQTILKESAPTTEEIDNFFLHDLELFFKLVRKYNKTNKKTWISIGKIKTQLHYFIKQYYTRLSRDLPPGYGYSKWRHTHFSSEEFVAKLKSAFPIIPHHKWEKWLPNIL